MRPYRTCNRRSQALRYGGLRLSGCHCRFFYWIEDFYGKLIPLVYDQYFQDIIASIAKQFLWRPDYLVNLYLDDTDEFGLIFWFKEVQEDEKREKDAQKNAK
jgi:hypothetical protein